MLFAERFSHLKRLQVVYNSLKPLTKKIERNKLIEIVGTAESASEHPLGSAVFNFAKKVRLITYG